MRYKKLNKNKKAQVLGLPMYLIIIMIVAVAVIAAVLFMMPQGNKMINAQVTTGSVVSAGTLENDGTYNFDDFDVVVKVTTGDERSDPIVGATVRLSGGGIIAEKPTDNTGTASFTGADQISGAKLDPNVNNGNIKLTVKASGFEDYTDDSAVSLYRP